MWGAAGRRISDRAGVVLIDEPRALLFDSDKPFPVYWLPEYFLLHPHTKDAIYGYIWHSNRSLHVTGQMYGWARYRS
jgi:hypothetical protein